MVVTPNQRSFTIRTDRALGKISGRHAGHKTTTAALQSPGDAIAHGFFGNFEPDCEIEGGAMSGENRGETLRLWHGAGKPIENKSVRAVQSQPVFNQLHDRCVRNEPASLNNLGRLSPQWRAKVFLSPQDRTRRSDRYPKLARDQFSLGTFPRTGCAEQNKPFLHSAAVKENRDPTDDENGDRDVKPHQRALRRRLATVVGRACIERSPANPPFSQKSVVVPLNKMRFHLPHRIKHDTYDNEQARSAKKLRRNLRNVKSLAEQAGQHRDQSEKNRAGKSKARHGVIEEIRCRFARAHARNIATMLL